MKSSDRPQPRPAYMSKEQQAEYLQSLRSKPLGSRPVPAGKSPCSRNINLEGHAHKQLHQSASLPAIRDAPLRPSRSPFAGRPLAQVPTLEKPSNTITNEALASHARRTSGLYVERGTRWMERQETKSIRMAMEDMDLGEEKRIHAAAQDEAAELVWKHQTANNASTTPYAPYVNPDIQDKKDYRSHLRRGSYQRSHNTTEPLSTVAEQQIESLVGADEAKDVDRAHTRKVVPLPSTSHTTQDRQSPTGKRYGALAKAVASDIEQARRRSSGGSKRIMSGEKKPYMNPNDRIWEDSEVSALPRRTGFSELQINAPAWSPPSQARKNPFARVRLQQESLERTNSAPDLHVVKHDQIEIQRNPPSQSRNPYYTSNDAHLVSNPIQSQERGATAPCQDREIRPDDIRSATSKHRHDRSPNLPEPRLVSDRPGRPIISFKKKGEPSEIVMQEIKSEAPDMDRLDQEPVKRRSTFNPEPMKMPGPQLARPATSHGAPTIPVLNLPDEDDTVSETRNVETSRGRTPSMKIPKMPPASGRTAHETSNRVSEAILLGDRPAMHHSASSPLPRSIPHITPFVRPASAVCAHCALPIAGRILSAAGQRFHPSCFNCHECHTNLELVAFYPEPDEKRVARLCEDPQDNVADHDFRFYCHLDYHELFSPRCKSCKTPIEGEVIVACGSEWHAGHFFCAQCGDPFDSNTPFVETDGYAWCVGCHTHRYSSKCRKCRKPVTDLVVKALGADWHENCFICAECDAPFKDGRFFLRGEEQLPVCISCEERRLKA